MARLHQNFERPLVKLEVCTLLEIPPVLVGHKMFSCIHYLQHIDPSSSDSVTHGWKSAVCDVLLNVKSQNSMVYQLQWQCIFSETEVSFEGTELSFKCTDIAIFGRFMFHQRFEQTLRHMRFCIGSQGNLVLKTFSRSSFVSGFLQSVSKRRDRCVTLMRDWMGLAWL